MVSKDGGWVQGGPVCPLAGGGGLTNNIKCIWDVLTVTIYMSVIPRDTTHLTQGIFGPRLESLRYWEFGPKGPTNKIRIPVWQMQAFKSFPDFRRLLRLLTLSLC